MSATSNADASAAVHNPWPHHDPLTHLAVHTPIQVPQQNGAKGALPPTSYPVSAALSFPSPFRFGFSAAATPNNNTAAITTVSPSGAASIPYNNNNKLEDAEMIEEPKEVKSEWNPPPPADELWTPLSALVTQLRPRSEMGGLETASHQNTFGTHHPLLSPEPLHRQKPKDLSPQAAGIAHPQPFGGLKMENTVSPDLPHSHDLSSTVSNDSTRSGSRDAAAVEPIPRSTLNDDETARILLTLSQNFATSAAETTVTTDSSPAQAKPANPKRTFFRAPGREAPSAQSAADGLVCPVCGFSCPSRFHYNSHMNTHGCHRCPICNYTSRTEGRLKKHMSDSHTEAQRQEAIREAANKSGGDVEVNVVDEDSGLPMPTPARLPEALEQIRVLTDGTPNRFGDENTPKIGDPLGIAASTPSTSRRSGVKPKKYRCKQCTHVATTKEDHWLHNRTHIPEEKQLRCPDCLFITEYKHHLQYHMRNHAGSKPFKCSKCEYTCVNKSMLNSHMKSHTSVYQFRCQDCTYQTKYCHSLKMHTFKYNHRRVQGQVLGGENGESHDEEIPEGIETESMKNYDIPNDDADALERHRSRELDDDRVPMPENNNPTDLIQQTASRVEGLLNATTTAAPPSHTQQPTPLIASHLNRLFQPLPQTTANNQLQYLIQHHQQLGRVQEIARNFMQNRHKCDICDFGAPTQEELVAHKMSHFMFNQQPLQLNVYQNALLLQQQQNATNLQNLLAMRVHQPAATTAAAAPPAPIQVDPQLQKPMKSEITAESCETPDPSVAATSASSPPAHGEHYAEDHMSGSSEMHDEVGETSSSPSDSHKSPGSSGGSPHSSTTSTTAAHSGAKKRKARKLDEISQRLQKCSPDNREEHSSPDVEEKPEKKRNLSEGLEAPIPSMAPLSGLQNGANGRFGSLIAQFANLQDRAQMSYTCQHCKMGFQDQALYQIHLGYHGYDKPFKCNRCGHAASSALDFNLHLYQEKH